MTTVANFIILSSNTLWDDDFVLLGNECVLLDDDDNDDDDLHPPPMPPPLVRQVAYHMPFESTTDQPEVVEQDLVAENAVAHKPILKHASVLMKYSSNLYQYVRALCVGPKS